MIDERQARALAEQVLGVGTSSKLRYEFSSVAPDHRLENTWTVIFDVYNSHGDVIDGPVVLLVDKQSGAVRSPNSLFGLIAFDAWRIVAT